MNTLAVQTLRDRYQAVQLGIATHDARALWLLDGQRQAWADAHPYRMAATTTTDRAALPQLHLLLVARWSRALKDEYGDAVGVLPLVFLQGHGDHLYLRFVMDVVPSSVLLSVGSPYVDQHSLPVRAEHLVEGSRRFALPALNGGGPWGSLWKLPRTRPFDVLGPDGSRMELKVALDPNERPQSMGTIDIPALGGPRAGFDEPDPRKAERQLRAAIRAYSANDARSFARTVDWFVESDNRPRELRKWQVIWLRAMLAELRKRGDRTWRRFGGPRSQANPQLLLPG